MATKDWKKTREGHYEWNGKLNKISYHGSEHKPKVTIIKNRFEKWAVFYNSKSGFIREKSFKTKTEALKFAKEYMRKH